MEDGLPSNSVLAITQTPGGYLIGEFAGRVRKVSPSVITAAIDIKPGTYPNAINLGSNGAIPVAILSSADFDAATVNVATVTLASAPVKILCRPWD